MKKLNYVAMLRYLAKKPAYLEHLGGANFFAVLLALLSTFAFSSLKLIRFDNAVS